MVDKIPASDRGEKNIIKSNTQLERTSRRLERDRERERERETDRESDCDRCDKQN